MRKLFLLLSTGLFVTSIVSAQQSHSIMLQSKSEAGIRTTTAKPAGASNVHSANNTANKSTSGSGALGWWFSFQNASNDQIQADLLIDYPDSTLYNAAGSPAFFWWCHGSGTSFDPTSVYFQNNWTNTALTPPPFVVTSANAYSVDSVEVVGFQHRHFANDVDTLYVEIGVGVDQVLPQSDFISSTGQPVNFPGEGTSEDTLLRVSEPFYNADANNIMATGSVKQYVKILDAAAVADTLSNGVSDWFIEIPGGPINVPKGKHLVAYTHYAPQTRVALSTDLDSANFWEAFTYDLTLSPLQLSGDFNQGLIATTEDRYNLNPGAWQLSASQFGLNPAYLFTAPTFAHDPYYNFHLTCTTCNDVAVANVNKTLTGVNVSPNPAVSDLNVNFKLAQNANVTVTLTNAIGQVVSVQNMGNVATGRATFNAATLASGIYIYTVQANGERMTGRAVVAH